MNEENNDILDRDACRRYRETFRPKWQDLEEEQPNDPPKWLYPLMGLGLLIWCGFIVWLVNNVGI